jgi:hypothetical protein
VDRVCINDSLSSPEGRKFFDFLPSVFNKARKKTGIFESGLFRQEQEE